MNAITTFFKVFGILVVIPVALLLLPLSILLYLIWKGILDSESIMVIFGSSVFFAILNTAWVFYLLRTAVSFGWISG